MRSDRPRYLDCGEAALSVEFGDRVDPDIHARVLALDETLRAAAIAGLRETTPTYRALLVRYEPLEMSRDALVARIENLVSSAVPVQPLPASGTDVRWIIPCCYDPLLAEDIAEAAQALDLAGDTVARLHAGGALRAYMYGFAPGWLYLGGLPEALAIPRRLAPRSPTPQGAVLIGGGLSLIAANPMPTGWYVIGRTPERLYSPERAAPFLIAPGATVQFEAIDAPTFAALEARAAQGEIVSRREAPA